MENHVYAQQASNRDAEYHISVMPLFEELGDCGKFKSNVCMYRKSKDSSDNDKDAEEQDEEAYIELDYAHNEEQNEDDDSNTDSNGEYF